MDGGGNCYFVFKSLLARGKKLLWNLAGSAAKALEPLLRVQQQEQSIVGGKRFTPDGQYIIDTLIKNERK